MILYSAIAAITILVACQINNHPVKIDIGITRQQALNKVYLTVIFSILFLLAALRLEVGNDYWTYVVTCHEIAENGYVVTEPGYNFVVKALYLISGKEDYLLMFAVFAFATTFIFMKSIYNQADNFALGFFLFIALGIYFRSFNTVRYYFALAITLYSFRYVLKKEYIKFIILILFAALFHKSVLVVIPLYIIANRTLKKWQIMIFALVCASFLVGKDFYMQIALKLYPSYQNTPYLNETGGITDNIFSIIRCVAVLVLCFICYKETIKDSKENIFYFNLNLMAIALYTCCSFIPLLSRFGYYLVTSHILLIPNVICRVEDKKKKRIILIFTVFIAIMYFLLFLKTASADGIRVLPYKSWLFYEREWFNATKIF